MSVNCIIKGAKEIKTYIDNNKLDFTHLAIMGSSGALLGAMILLLHNEQNPLNTKEFIYVRKDGEKSRYSPDYIKGTIVFWRPVKYIIVDDCIETGDTVRAIYQKIAFRYPNSTCVKIISFNSVPTSPEKIKLGDTEHTIIYTCNQ